MSDKSESAVERGPNGFPYVDTERCEVSRWQTGDYHLKIVRDGGERVDVNLDENQFNALKKAINHVDGDGEPELVTDGGVGRDTCEGCGRVETPTRSILMKSGEREDLCESCFVEALEDGRVDPTDPRVETTEVA